MAIANTVLAYLQANRIPYAVLSHRHTNSSRDTAKTLHVPPERLAKAVVLADERGCVMAVLPSNRHVDVQELSHVLGRDLAVVPEYRTEALFKDCELGAIPPLGFAYGVPTVIDDCLVDEPEIYFEAGDHEEVIRLDGEEFQELLKKATVAEFCQ